MSHPDNEHVPSLPELYAMDPSLAKPIEWVKGDKKGEMKPSKWTTTPAGHAYLGAIMRRNAERAIARGEGNWVQPPNSGEVVKDAS